ncbi:hypothetical protein Q5P01_007298 [Channa striata]|uniref:SRCR domain-containing protein n=1 Tax=Channa striata TaxID=64152 RepID=A0AA88SYH9_CHASR|nr:hypothetical protein Q5P01_007298 [Channa striata]
MDYVDCSGSESSLWHCRGKRDKNLFPCSSSAYVVCEGSVNVTLMDGPGRCAGRVEILHEGHWKRQLVELTCTDHKMLLLLGDCSGMVSIVQDGETYWLSGSNETWNENTANLVCQQKHCGVAVNFTAENFTSVQDAEKKLLTASLCPRDAESLFDCLELNTMSPDLNATVASVTCSGKINITLSRGCWGVVTICMGGACGGVFADTWTMDQSQMLCKNLGCGEKALEAAKDSKDVMMFKSLHSTKHITQLSQSNFLKCNNSKGMCYSNPAYVVCSGSVKPRLSNSRDKCMGNVELSYEDSWLPVSNVLKEKEIRTLCKELNCGNGGELMGYFGQKPENRPTSLVCPTNHKGSLRECDISRSNTTNSKVTGLKCSKWRKMKVSGPCGGEVFVETDGNKSPVSSEGWNKTEGKSLCKDLGCPTSDEDPPTQKAQKLLIECKDVPVSLSQTCSGVVKINELEVCSTGWKTMYSHLVCQERNCSNAVVGAESFHAPMANKEYYHVRCDYGEDRLGQCERVKGRCNDKLVSVYCVGGVQFRTAHICGGFIEVKYQDKWEKICPINLKPHTMDDLCKRMNCHSQIKGMKTSESNVLLNMKTSLDCTEGCMDPRHCVRAKGCEKVRPAEIFCEGYQPPEPPQPPSTPTPVLSIILGVGFFLVLVILIVVFVRICLAKRARKAMKLPARMMSHKDVEFESGDYEDVKANEMEDFSRGRFRSESEVILDSDGRSVSSFHYDDVDEAVDTQPLTSQGSVTGASGDNHLHEDALESNKATYEVDDPQESYDDIEAGSEITQTEAEVHKNHQPPPESDSLPPPDLVQGDDDYLVPDQHG